MCYDSSLKVLKQEKTLYRNYTRELNGIPVTECLPYIYLANGLYYTKPSLS